jgi:hypothetical protein
MAAHCLERSKSDELDLCDDGCDGPTTRCASQVSRLITCLRLADDYRNEFVDTGRCIDELRRTARGWRPVWRRVEVDLNSEENLKKGGASSGTGRSAPSLPSGTFSQLPWLAESQTQAGSRSRSSPCHGPPRLQARKPSTCSRVSWVGPRTSGWRAARYSAKVIRLSARATTVPGRSVDATVVR